MVIANSRTKIGIFSAKRKYIHNHTPTLILLHLALLFNHAICYKKKKKKKKKDKQCTTTKYKLHKTE